MVIVYYGIGEESNRFPVRSLRGFQENVTRRSIKSYLNFVEGTWFCYECCSVCHKIPTVSLADRISCYPVTYILVLAPDVEINSPELMGKRCELGTVIG